LIVAGMAMPPIELYGPLMLAAESGKLGTPCARIQLANATCAVPFEVPLAADTLRLVADPHAAIASAHVAATRMIRKLSLLGFTIASVVADTR